MLGLNNAANAAGGYGVSGLGPVGNLLGIYSGLKAGPKGMITAGTNAAELYNAYTAATGASSGASAAGGAVAGGGMAAAAGSAGMGVMLAIAAHQPGVSFSKSYWDGLNKTLAAGPGTETAKPGSLEYGQQIKQYTSYEGALSDLRNAYAGAATGGNNQVPGGETAFVNAHPDIANYLNWAAYDATPARAAAISAAVNHPANGVPVFSGTSRQHM